MTGAALQRHYDHFDTFLKYEKLKQQFLVLYSDTHVREHAQIF